jgi:pimeloyl-ACP methyl ester carboxylesterase
VDRYGHGGRPVVLVHGFGTCSFLWRHVGPSLAENTCSAFAVDLLGYGESDRPFDADFGITAQSEYLDRALTALRLAKAVVVGVDLGAAVALRLAATRPERVHRLVLINCLAYEDVPGKDVRTLQRNTARFAFRITRGVLGAAPLLRPVLEESVASPDHMPARLIARYLAPYVGKDGVTHLLVLARSIRAEDIQQIDLRQVSTPTLIVWGERDPWLDPRIPDRLATEIPSNRLVRLPSIGRLAPEEDPAMLAELLIEFSRGSL